MTPANSTVVHVTDSYGSKSENGSWNGVVALVSNGVADIGIGDFTVTKERSEVVAFIDTVEISGYGITLLYIIYILIFKKYFCNLILSGKSLPI